MSKILKDEFRKIVEDANTSQHLPTMSVAAISEMEARKHDLEFQVDLCIQMMKEGELLPFAFDRAAILLRKAGRYDAERIICEYAEKWAERSKTEYTEGAMLWMSPKIQKLITRLAKIRSGDS